MADLKALAEQIVGLTLLEAQELKTILKDEYGIEPAAGGAVMMAGPAAGGDAAAAEEKDEFDLPDHCEWNAGLYHDHSLEEDQPETQNPCDLQRAAPAVRCQNAQHEGTDPADGIAHGRLRYRPFAAGG